MRSVLGMIAALLFCVTAATAQPVGERPDGQFTPPTTIAPPTTPRPVATAPAVGGTQITTTAPVSSETSISVGTLAGQVLTWLAAAFSVPVGTVLVVWLTRLMKIAGVQNTDLLKAQLQGIVVNALNSAAANASRNLQGQAPVAIKSQVIADAVAYAQAHGAETIKALGLDPNSGEAVEAIKARIETALNDPTQPTPPTITPTVGQPKTA